MYVEVLVEPDVKPVQKETEPAVSSRSTAVQVYPNTRSVGTQGNTYPRTLRSQSAQVWMDGLPLFLSPVKRKRCGEAMRRQNSSLHILYCRPRMSNPCSASLVERTVVVECGKVKRWRPHRAASSPPVLPSHREQPGVQCALGEADYQDESTRTLDGSLERSRV